MLSKEGESGEGEAELFFLGCSDDRTYGNGPKLHQKRFRQDIMKHFFTERGQTLEQASLRDSQCPKLVSVLRGI